MFSFISIEVLLLIAFIIVLRIDLSTAPVAEIIAPSKKIPLNRYWIFYGFVFILSINSGLMHQVIYPYFQQHQVLVSLYTNLPFILTVYILSRSPKTNKLNVLYIGLVLWGLTFIAFSLSGPTELGYLIVFTLMLAGSGIFSFFLWSLMTSNFEHVVNPSSFFGLGLSLNVLGVWFGGLIGNLLINYGVNHQAIANLGLVIVLVSMVIFLPLNQKLSTFIHQNHFMIKLSDVHQKQKKTYIEEAKGLLSEREYEVFCHLIKGETDPTISKLLYISLNTTKTHNRKIYRKLSVSGRKELIEKCD